MGNKYDARNMDKRVDRDKKHLLRANKELAEMIDRDSKDITINVIQDAPNSYKDEYVVIFKLKHQMTPIQFQTLLSNKLRDLF